MGVHFLCLNGPMVTAEEWHVSFTRKDGGSDREDGKRGSFVAVRADL